MEHKDTKTQRFLNFWFFNNYFVSLCLCVQKMLSEDDTEGVFDLADGVEGDVLFFRIQTLEVVFWYDHIRKAQFLCFCDALFDAVDRSYLS